MNKGNQMTLINDSKDQTVLTKNQAEGIAQKLNSANDDFTYQANPVSSLNGYIINVYDDTGLLLGAL